MRDSSVELSPSPTQRDSTNSSGLPTTPDLPGPSGIDGKSGVEEGGKGGSNVVRQKGLLFNV